jgi:hypothetical protein
MGATKPVELSEILNASFDRLYEATRFVHEWQVVMACTFAEAFLQDVLVEGMTANPRLLASADLTIAYDAIVDAASLDALRADIYAKRARTFIDDGGPTRWSSRLSRICVSGLPKDQPLLEEAWGVRHMVVHRASIASPDFVRRHPRVKAKPGEPLLLLPLQVIEYVEGIDTFVRLVDDSFAGYIDAFVPKAV